MKIVYLSSARIPSGTANSIHIMKMCGAFAELGHNTWLTAQVESSQGPEIFDYYGVRREFSILNKAPFSGVRYLGHISSLMSMIQVRRRNPDFVVARDTTAAYLSSLFSVPTYYEIHGPVWEAGKLTAWLFKRMLVHKGFRALVVITHTLKVLYEKRYPELRGRIEVLPDGADLFDVENAGSAGVAVPGKVNVGYTGHLYTGKGMEIIARTAKLMPEAHFHVIGGNEEDVVRWRQRICDIGNVTFYGLQPPSAIPAFLNDFDIVLLPNQVEVRGNAGKDIGRWTSPLKLFEYMAAEKPIISSDLPVLREIVRHGENAHLCPPDQPEAWVEAIEKIANDRDYAKKISAQAKRDFESKYTWKQRAQKLIDFHLTTGK